MTLKQGLNPTTAITWGFDKEWSYCYLVKDALWLSSIIVKEKYRRQGRLKALLEKAKTLAKRVIIPTPSGVLVHTATKLGYHFTTVKYKGETLTAMVYAQR